MHTTATPAVPYCPRCGSTDLQKDPPFRIMYYECNACYLDILGELAPTAPLPADAAAIWSQLLAIAQAAGQPAHYPQDFYVHDRAALAGGLHTFAWGIYESGTHLIPAGHAQARAMAKSLAAWYAPVSWYWCDGGTVRPSDHARITKKLYTWRAA